MVVQEEVEGKILLCYEATLFCSETVEHITPIVEEREAALVSSVAASYPVRVMVERGHVSVVRIIGKHWVRIMGKKH